MPNQPPCLLRIFALSALLLSAQICAAQSTPAETPAAPAKATPAPTPTPAKTSAKPTRHSEDDPVTLTPFEVNVEKDRGFAGTNAGTATKLGLDLQDLPAPYSVITKDFIDALNLTNLNDIGSWTTNGGVTYDGQGSDIFGSTTQFSMRGEPVNGGMQRNFFLTAGLSDSYNSERVDFGRGPNAVLFNVGANSALGGGVSVQTKQARLDRTTGEVAFTLGSWDYKRATFDYNQSVTRGFSVRVNGVDFDRKGYIHGDFQKTRGMTVGTKIRLGPKTELRAEVQNDLTQRSNPTIQWVENISGWDGKTVFNAPITNLVYGPNTAVPGAPNGLGQTITYRGEVQGVERQGGASSTPYYVYIPGESTVMNWQNMGTTRRADSTTRVPVYTDGGVWSRNGDNNLKQWISGSPMFEYNLDIPQDWLANAIAHSKFKIPGKRDTFMVDAPIVTEKTNNVTLGLSHQFAENLFFDISGAVDKVHQKINSSALSYRTVSLDINQNLPDGSPNPYYLQGYGDANIAWRNIYTDNAGVRSNLAYRLNGGRWGNYTFDLTGAYNTRSIKERNYNLSLAQNTDPRQWQGGNDQVRSREYFIDGFAKLFDVGVPTTVRLTNWAADNNSATSTTGTVLPRWVLNNWQDRKEQTKSAILATAAKFFSDRLVFTLGGRVDDRTTKTRSRLVNFADLPADPNWDGATLDDRYWRQDAPADWRTLTYISKNADGTPRTNIPLSAVNRPRTGVNQNNWQMADPLYNTDRFRSDYNNPQARSTGINSTFGAVYHVLPWISLKANYGNSYKPADTGVFTLEGLDAEAQTGKAWDAKVNFTFFNRRLDIGIGYYYNLLNFSTVDPPVKASINSLLGRNAANDGTPDGRNARNLPDIYGTDYQSRDNRGFELEMTGEPLRGWRVFANFGTAKSKTFDRYPQMVPFVQANAAAFLLVLQDAGGKLDTTAKPVGGALAPGLAVADPTVTPLLTAERDGAVNDYNNIWINYTSALSTPNTVGFNRVRINANTDYTIQTGTLRGFRFGFGVQYATHNKAGDHSLDLVPNPSYNSSIATSSSNLPYKDNPNVSSIDNLWVSQPLNTYLTLAYSTKVRSQLRVFSGTVLEYQLLVTNPLNRQMVVYQDSFSALRPVAGKPDSQYWETVPVRIGQYQAPVSFQFTTRLKF